MILELELGFNVLNPNRQTAIPLGSIKLTSLVNVVQVEMGQDALPSPDIMTGVFDHQSKVVFLREFNTSCNIGRFGCVDTVDRRATQIAYRTSSYRAIDRGACIDDRIREPNWRCFSEGRLLVDFAYLLTLRGAFLQAVVTWFGERFVGDEMPVNCPV